MRLLFLCPRQFWPTDTGAKLRNRHLAHQLSRSFAVSIVTFGEAGSDRQPPDEIAEWAQAIHVVDRVEGRSAVQLARGLVGPYPAPVLSYANDEMERTIRRVLENETFDVVQIESIHLVTYLPLIRELAPRAKVVMDWHNIESELMDRFAAGQTNPLKRLYALRTAVALRKLEEQAVRQVDLVSVCSAREVLSVQQGFSPKCPVVCVENGVDAGYFASCEAVPRRAPSHVVFVGSMDYHANVDAVTWFVETLWGDVTERLGQVELRIIGRRPSPAVVGLERFDGVLVLGGVDDIRSAYSGALASIVPLRTGGGTRLKILEAMAAGTPVISTRIGAEGLDLRDGEQVLYAEDGADFSNAIARLEKDHALWERLSRAGREFVSEHYDWPSIGARMRTHVGGLSGLGPSAGGISGLSSTAAISIAR